MSEYIKQWGKTRLGSTRYIYVVDFIWVWGFNVLLATWAQCIGALRSRLNGALESMRKKCHRYLGILQWKKMYRHLHNVLCPLDTHKRSPSLVEHPGKGWGKQHHFHELFLEVTDDSRRQCTGTDPLDFDEIKNHGVPWTILCLCSISRYQISVTNLVFFKDGVVKRVWLTGPYGGGHRRKAM